MFYFERISTLYHSVCCDLKKITSQNHLILDTNVNIFSPKVSRQYFTIVNLWSKHLLFAITIKNVIILLLFTTTLTSKYSKSTYVYHLWNTDQPMFSRLFIVSKTENNTNRNMDHCWKCSIDLAICSKM